VRKVQSFDCILQYIAIVILLPFYKSFDTIIAAVYYCYIAIILNYCPALVLVYLDGYQELVGIDDKIIFHG